MKAFYIYATKWNRSQLYKVRVDILYRSEQIIKVKITAGERNIHAVKYLLRKNHQWKLESDNFRLEIGKKDNLLTFERITMQIDAFLKGPPLPRIHPKNANN